MGFNFFINFWPFIIMNIKLITNLKLCHRKWNLTQNLKEAVSISLMLMPLGEGMNPSLFLIPSPTMGK